MNPELQEKLNSLLKEYPELEGKNLNFGSSIRFLDSDENSEKCKINKAEFLDFLEGPSHKIQVRKSGTHGYGVFAKEPIKEGEQIEESRLLRLHLRSKYQYDLYLNDYIFSLAKCTCKECKTHGKIQYVGLGYISLYNHHDEPNAKVSIDSQLDIMRIRALQDIPAGSEIFINYGEEYWLMRKIWRGFRLNA